MEKIIRKRLTVSKDVFQTLCKEFDAKSASVYNALAGRSFSAKANAICERAVELGAAVTKQVVWQEKTSAFAALTK